MEVAAAASLGVTAAPAPDVLAVPNWVTDAGIEAGYSWIREQDMLAALENPESSKVLAVQCAHEVVRLQGQNQELKGQLQAEQAQSRRSLALLQQINQLSAAMDGAAASTGGTLPVVPSLVLVKPEGGSKRKAADGAPQNAHLQKRSRKSKAQQSATEAVPLGERCVVQRITGPCLDPHEQLQVYRIKYKEQDYFVEADAIRLAGGGCNDITLIRRVSVACIQVLRHTMCSRLMCIRSSFGAGALQRM